jgi:hypothetical protein
MSRAPRNKRTIRRPGAVLFYRMMVFLEQGPLTVGDIALILSIAKSVAYELIRLAQRHHLITPCGVRTLPKGKRGKKPLLWKALPRLPELIVPAKTSTEPPSLLQSQGRPPG